MKAWLLLIYKVPSEPSAKRVYVWRKLKGMGALLVQDSAWVLPANRQTREKLQWLAAEIKDMEGGFATMWEADLVFTGNDHDIAQQFMKQTDEIYREILNQMDHADNDLTALSKRYQQAKTQDYFDSPLGEEVRQALLRRREGNS